MILDPDPVATVHAAKPKPLALCETCRWWVAWAHQPNRGPGHPPMVVGECRHRSPYIVSKPQPDGPPQPNTKWPSVRSTDFCGSHSPAPEWGEGGAS